MPMLGNLPPMPKDYQWGDVLKRLEELHDTYMAREAEINTPQQYRNKDLGDRIEASLDQLMTAYSNWKEQ